MTNASKAQITSYAKNEPAGIAYFTTSDPDDPQHVPQLVPFNNIVTSLMTNMSDLFYNAGTFNQDISSWDTAIVTNMSDVMSINKCTEILNLNGMGVGKIAQTE